MEQFKELKWSWYKYKEEKNPPTKNYNFETISEQDVLSRTLNEVHKCVLPKKTEYCLMKPQEDEQSADEDIEEVANEAKDPRNNPTRIIKNSKELTRCYGYSSELTMQQQRVIMNSFQLKIKHNPALCKQLSPRKQRQQSQLLPKLEAKRKVESFHFNQCAETYYYRHISELKSILGKDIRTFLINQWEVQESAESDCNFKAITMLLRGQKCEGEVNVELENTESDEFDHKSYLITDDTFLPLNKFSAESLEAYGDLKKDRVEQSAGVDSTAQHDIALSIDVIANLLVDTERFTVTFDNRKNSENEKMTSTFNEPLPLKPVSIAKAIEETVRTALVMGHEWNCLENFLKSNVKDCITNDSNCYNVQSTTNLMTNKYNQFKKVSGKNQTLTSWSISKDSQQFHLLVKQNDIFFIETDESSLAKTNISIKIEYQLKFGAEKMERSELLREWCFQKFNAKSITLRYRIDANTLTILSVTKVSLREIEDELLNCYQTNPNVTLGGLINILSCIKRLPESKYKIKTTIEEGVKKLFIYKACENSEVIQLNEPWTIATEFVRSWIPIDDSTTTFVHLNHQLPPCCFVPTNKRKLISYLQPSQQEKKRVKKSPVEQKHNQKQNKKKNKKRNSKV